MHSPALAIAWELRRRHRWGLIGVLAYFVGLAAIRLVQRVAFESDEAFAFAVLVPMSATVLYFVAVFTFGLAGDIAARESMYPRRMFTLPVTTTALAAWPMLYGALAMAVLWLGTRLLATWPAGVDVPVFWPLLLAPVALAWTQALTWMAYPLPGLRVIVTVLWMTIIDAVVMTALELKASNGVMFALLAPHLPIAFLVARHAVGKARRGEVPDWRGVFAARRSARLREGFSSTARAQEWLEWRSHGRALPAMVAIVVPFELSLLFLFGHVPVIVFEVLVCVALTPPFMASFVAATVSYDVTSFLATRPVSNASIIVAKLKVTLRSTLAAWLLIGIATPIVLRAAHATDGVIEAWRVLTGAIGTPRAVILVLLAVAALVVSTWKQLVQSLYIGMTGRDWLVKANVFVVLAFLTVLVPLLDWIGRDKALIAILWNAFPWILAALVCAKLVAGGWIAMRLHEGGLLSERALVAGAACWSALVFALYGLLAWLLPALIFHRYFLALIAILGIPLARLAAAPLALAWNRHR